MAGEGRKERAAAPIYRRDCGKNRKPNALAFSGYPVASPCCNSTCPGRTLPRIVLPNSCSQPEPFNRLLRTGMWSLESQRHSGRWGLQIDFSPATEDTYSHLVFRLLYRSFEPAPLKGHYRRGWDDLPSPSTNNLQLVRVCL